MSGIAAFINGGVEGINMRHNWDDRKRRQALEDEQNEWAREDRTYTLSERERVAAERARKAAEDARMRSVFQSAVDDTNAAMAEDGASAAESPELGIVPQAPSDIEETVLPPIGQEQAVPADTPEAVAQDTAMALQGGSPVGQVPLQTSPERGVVQPPSEEKAAASEGYQLIQGGLENNGRIYQHAETGQLAFASDGRSSNDQAEIEQMLAVVPKDGGSIASNLQQGGAQQPQSPQQAGGGAQAAPQAADASQPPSAQIATAVVAEAQNERSVAPNGNANTPVAVQRDRATRSFMQNYMDVGAPQVIEYYLSVGNVEAARKFDTWIREDGVREGMEAYSQAVFAASIGDEDGFLDSLAEAYNARGYFDDNVTVNRTDSGFTRDGNGNINGASLSFTDGDTGKTFTQQFDDPNDIIRAGLRIMSPENVFAEGQRQVVAADQARAAQAKHEQAMELQLLRNQGGSSGSGGETDAELFDAAREELMGDGVIGGASKTVDGVIIPFRDWPQEEQNAAIAELVNNRKQGIASLGTVAGNAPPPVWRGE